MAVMARKLYIYIYVYIYAYNVIVFLVFLLDWWEEKKLRLVDLI